MSLFVFRNIALVFLSTVACEAAEVGCDAAYSPSFTSEQAARRWPSGAMPTSSNCSVGYVRGEITRGDYTRVVRILRTHHPFVHAFNLQSSGGDVREAIQIGQLFRRYQIKAIAPTFILGRFRLTTTNPARSSFCDGPQCVCASACGLIWFGAPEREGRIGLHRPRISDPAFRTLPAAEASTAYNEALRAIRQYLNEMEAPSSAIEAMVSTGSSDIVWVDDYVSGGPRFSRAPSFAEWTDAACGSFPADAYDTLILLGAKSLDDVLSPDEETQREALQNKLFAKVRCEAELTSSNRDKLPPP